MEQIRIFVSGTQNDLQVEREVVDNALTSQFKSMQIEVIRAETQGAKEYPSRKACQRFARICNIYIGVYGHKYGFEIQPENISVTEMEFNTAQYHRKPILIYVKKLKDGERRDQKQSEFIHRVLDFDKGYFRRPEFSSPDELAQWILHDVTELISRIVREHPSESDSPTRPGDLPIGSFVSFPRNTYFTGRSEELEKLVESLLNQSRINTVRTQIISGMGGVGKTQLAVELAYKFGWKFIGVHWLNLEKPETLDNEIAACGEKMGLRHWPEKLSEQVAFTLNIWKEKGPRLLILDNFENLEKAPEVIARLQHSNLRILVTSRHSDWPGNIGVKVYPLDIFSQKESVELLKKYYIDKNIEDLFDLAEILGNLPLALELAGRYLQAHPHLAITDYILQLGEVLLHPSMAGWREDLPSLTGHELSLLRTFVLSWEQIKDENVKAIFIVAGYLSPNVVIPLGLFEETLDLPSGTCDEAIHVLIGLGLFYTRDSFQPTTHPLLAEFGRIQSKRRGMKTLLLERLTQSLITFSNIKENEIKRTGSLEGINSYLPHILTVVEYSDKEGIQDAAKLYTCLGIFLKQISDFEGSKIAFTHALRIEESRYGPNHPILSTPLGNLGYLLLELGDLVGARVVFERSVQIDEATYGPDHPMVAQRINGKGLVLLAMGDYAGARSCFERALHIGETIYGKDRIDVAQYLHNLGNALMELGDLPGAKAAIERGLHITEATYGPEHPEVAICVSCLGLLHMKMGDITEARVLFERALHIDELKLGPKHQRIAIRLNNLGQIMRLSGDFSGAKAAYERAIQIDEEVYGPEHPETARRINNLGNVLHDLGDLVGAREAYERFLAIAKKFLPANHKEIKTAEDNIRKLSD